MEYWLITTGNDFQLFTFLPIKYLISSIICRAVPNKWVANLSNVKTHVIWLTNRMLAYLVAQILDRDSLKTHESNRSNKTDFQSHHSTCCLLLTDRFKQEKIESLQWQQGDRDG